MRYEILLSDAKTGIEWNIDASSDLTHDEHEFLKTFCPSVFFNDIDLYHWAFDKKLPSGRWLENIRFSSDLKMAHAYIA